MVTSLPEGKTHMSHQTLEDICNVEESPCDFYSALCNTAAAKSVTAPDLGAGTHHWTLAKETLPALQPVTDLHKSLRILIQILITMGMITTVPHVKQRRIRMRC